MVWAIRVGIFVVGALATVVGLTVPSIYALLHLCSDLVFVILFPQLVAALYIPFVNTYGSIAAYLIGLLFRVTGGETLIGLPAAIHYPWYKNGEQYFPFRTMSMLISFATLIGVSAMTNRLFETGTLSMERKRCHGKIRGTTVPPASDVVLSESVIEECVEEECVGDQCVVKVGSDTA